MMEVIGAFLGLPVLWACDQAMPDMRWERRQGFQSL